MEREDAQSLVRPRRYPWTASVWNAAGKLVGTAALVGRRELISNAHVIPEDTTGMWVQFPFADGNREDARRRYHLKSRPQRDLEDDVALFTIDIDPPVVPAPVRAPHPADLWGSSWATFGFPHGDRRGDEALGAFGTELEAGWVRMDTEPERRSSLRRGFSGAGVWGATNDALVALFAEAREHDGHGRAVSMYVVRQCFPNSSIAELTAPTVADAGEVALREWGLAWSLADDPEAQAHWGPRARGATVNLEQGYHFRGRRAALQRIVAWLEAPREAPPAGPLEVPLEALPEAPEQGSLLVITGSPGVGKSAVLGRIVTTADETLRAQLPTTDDGVVAPPKSIACAVHAKGKTAEEIAAEIARAASARPPRDVDGLIPSLISELTQLPRKFHVVIDALDESTDVRRVIETIIVPLATVRSRATIRVLVGTRRNDGKGDGKDLLSLFGPTADIVDLDREEYFEADDLTAYAFSLLTVERPLGDVPNPYRHSSSAKHTAQRIAELADKNFLVAGLTARSHALKDHAPIPIDQIAFEPTVRAAMQQYIATIGPLTGHGGATVLAGEALATLAYAESPGFTLGLWRTALQALTSIDVTEDTLRAFATGSAGNFLVEGSLADTGGRSFRLFHQALNDALRHDAGPGDDAEAQARLTRAFLRFGDEVGWSATPEYLLRSLPRHAAQGDVLGDVLLDNDYLLHADVGRVREAAAGWAGLTANPEAWQRFRLLGLTPRAPDGSPADRAAALSIVEMEQNLQVRGVTDFATSAKRYGAPHAASWAATRPSDELAILTGHSSRVTAVCVVPRADGGSWLATGSYDGMVRVSDPITGQTARTLTGHISWVTAVCAVPAPDGGSWLATGSDDRTVRVWNPVTGQTVRTLTGHTSWVAAVCAVPAPDGGSWLVSGSDDGTVRVWNPVTGRTVRTLSGHTAAVTAVCAVPGQDGGIWLATGSYDGTVRVWDAATGQTISILPGHTSWVTAAHAVPRLDGGIWLATGSYDGTVRVWDVVAGHTVRILTGHIGAVTAVCVMPGVQGDSWLVSCSDDGTVRVWDPVTVRILHTPARLTGPVTAVCAMPGPGGGSWLASGSYDGTVRVWDPASGRPSHSPTGHTGPVNAACVAPTPDGRSWLATSSHDGTVRLWDPDSGQPVRTLAGHTGAVTAVCAIPVSDGNSWLAGGSHDGTVRLWDPGSGQPVRTLAGHTGAVTAVCAIPAPDGSTWLASSSHDRKVRVWDVATGQTLHTLDHFTGPVTAVCGIPSPDATTLLATGSWDGTVQVWDLITGQALHTLTGRVGGSVSAMCAVPAPDGRTWLVTGSDDQTLRVWDPATGLVLRTLTGHTGRVTAAHTVPAPDGGSWFTTGFDDGTVRVWDAVTGALLTAFSTYSIAHAFATFACWPSTRFSNDIASRLFVATTTGVLALDLNSSTIMRRLSA